MATHTPIPYWLSLPLRELFGWVEVAVEVQAEEERR
jgi:hypothetical protein